MVGSFYHNTLATITKYISYDTFKNSKNPYSLPLSPLQKTNKKKIIEIEKKEKIRDPKSTRHQKKIQFKVDHYTYVQNVSYFDMKVESESRLILERRI